MSDQGYHEIQLSGKQLVFLFMSAVVVAVVIFLLGVSVGRSVRQATQPSMAAAPGTAVGAPGDTSVPTATPTPTEVQPSDLSYPEMLQGSGAGKPGTMAAEPPPNPSAAPPAAATATPEPKTSQAAPKTPKPAPATETPSKPAATKPPPSPPARPVPSTAAPTRAGWMVQVGGFSTKARAEVQVRQLAGKGFDQAFVVEPVAPDTLFKVRLGPFADRADAARLVDRLKKAGFPSLITR